MRYMVLTAILGLGAGLWLASCGCGEEEPWSSIDGAEVDTVDDTTAPDAADAPLDTGADTAADYTGPPGTGTIRGVVYSPDPPAGADPSLTKFPISGALVYLSYDPPDPIPEGVYCHECVELPETVPNDLSESDGSFVIGGLHAGTYLLVVQKGEFRRVRPVDVFEDTVTEVPEAATTFPNRYFPASGDDTPSIAVVLGSYDDMQDIMAKIGLCDIDTDGHAILDTCDHIDFYTDEPLGPTSLAALIRDPALLARYHIIFIPCSGGGADMALWNATNRQNVRDWVAAGGKWYVADWSYDFVEQIFPDFVDFEGNDATIGAADGLSGSFDTTGHAVDSDLYDWLRDSIGVAPDGVLFEENWDCIQAIGSVPGTEPDGTPITITPDVYCEGPVTRDHSCMSPDAPLTLTFPFGCGKVLFTTYHTVGAMGGLHPDLLVQEKILVYMILEIGLCTEPVIII